MAAPRPTPSRASSRYSHTSRDDAMAPIAPRGGAYPVSASSSASDASSRDGDEPEPYIHDDLYGLTPSEAALARLLFKWQCLNCGAAQAFKLSPPMAAFTVQVAARSHELEPRISSAAELETCLAARRVAVSSAPALQVGDEVEVIHIDAGDERSFQVSAEEACSAPTPTEHDLNAAVCDVCGATPVRDRRRALGERGETAVLVEAALADLTLASTGDLNLNQTALEEGFKSTARAPHVSSSVALRYRSAQVGPVPPVRVVLCVHEDMLLHEEVQRIAAGAGKWFTLAGIQRIPVSKHPERPDRLRAIASHLAAAGLLSCCARTHARLATEAELLTVHSREHVRAMEALGGDGGAGVDLGSDNYVNGHTLRAAKMACGATLEVTREVVTGAADRGVALVRPPGHHAEPDRAMGFCFYNNVAVAAAAAVEHWGVQRVLILDWDVHHGNGTENIFYNDPRVMFISLHRHDSGFYPGTGHVHRVGKDAGAGYNVNIPWSRPEMGDADYLHAFDEVVMPIATCYSPQLVMVSCGFDAAQGDPLGGCHVTPAGYAHMMARLLTLAQGRVVVVLEGGYNLTSISRSMEAVLRTMLGQAPPPVHRFGSHIHARPSASSASLRGPGGALYDSMVKTRGRPAKVLPPEHVAGVERDDDPSAAPRADVFAFSKDEAEDVEEMYEAATRENALTDASPQRSAVQDVSMALLQHAPFWPCLQAKARMYASIYQRVAAPVQTRRQSAAALDSDASSTGVTRGMDGAMKVAYSLYYGGPRSPSNTSDESSSIARPPTAVSRPVSRAGRLESATLPGASSMPVAVSRSHTPVSERDSGALHAGGTRAEPIMIDVSSSSDDDDDEDQRVRPQVLLTLPRARTVQGSQTARLEPAAAAADDEDSSSSASLDSRSSSYSSSASASSASSSSSSGRSGRNVTREAWTPGGIQLGSNSRKRPRVVEME